MKEEIAAVVFFMARLVKKHGCLDNESRDRFAAALTFCLFENYKNHWYPHTPNKGQAYRCLRMNHVQPQDPVLKQACVKSEVRYKDLGLPHECTIWVDPGEVSCRYGEGSAPFCVTLLEGWRSGDREFSRQIKNAVERAGLDIQSGFSSDEEGGDTSTSSTSSFTALCPASVPPTNLKTKTIPTVSNPNSIYQFSEFAPAAPQSWVVYPKRKAFAGDGYLPHGPSFLQHSSQFPPAQKNFKPYRPSFSFTGPRVDKYHWVSKSRS